MSFLHSLLRTTFIKYYEIRRRFRGWHRRITYRPGITFYRKTRTRILKISFMALILWHMIGLSLKERRKKYNENITPLEFLLQRIGRERTKHDDPRFHYPSIFHKELGISKLKPDAKVEMFKEEYPMDEW